MPTKKTSHAASLANSRSPSRSGSGSRRKRAGGRRGSAEAAARPWQKQGSNRRGGGEGGSADSGLDTPGSDPDRTLSQCCLAGRWPDNRKWSTENRPRS